MKTKHLSSKRRFLTIGPLLAAAIMLVGCSQNVSAQWTNSTNINNTNSGNVGIGTTTPNYALEVNSGSAQYAVPAINILSSTHATSKRATIGFGLNSAVTLGWIFGQDRNANGTRDIFLYDLSNSRDVMYWSNSGNVGIGTTTPSERLELSGNIKVTGTGNINAAGTITGLNVVAKYQDVAEWVPSTEQLEAGTVVVLDPTKSNQVIFSRQPYDTRVAGVVSEQPGIVLGESGKGKVLVATTGRVLVKVDATKAPIHIGDLLATSDVPGVAMKSEPVTLSGIQLHRPGTIIGKALEPLEKGSAKILMLLSLQ